jgi:predicted RNA-binding protein with RPS1 domain
MKISLTQPNLRSHIWIDIESSNVCTRIFTSVTFDPYEEIYIWLGQIRDSQLPASMRIDEEGYIVELIAEEEINGMILFKIQPCYGPNITTILSTTITPYELIKSFHDGIIEFIKDGFRPSDWSIVHNLENINWGALLKVPTITHNWQKRLLMYNKLWAYDGIIKNNDLWQQLTLEQQWLIVLRDLLSSIAIIAKRKQAYDIQALASLYQSLPVDIALNEIDSEWYQERRNALNQEYELVWSRPIRREEREFNHTLKIARLKSLRVGQVLDGTVLRVKPYGLFVNIGGLNAILHISSISQILIEDLDRFFKEGDWIRAMIVWMDIEKGRISLSTSDLEVEPGDMLKQPWKVYETAEAMSERYYQNVLSKQVFD